MFILEIIMHFRFALSRVLCVVVLATMFGCTSARAPAPASRPAPVTLLCYAGINMRTSVEEIARQYEAKTGVHVTVEVNDPRPLLDKIEVSSAADDFVCHDPFLPILIDHGITPRTAYTAASLTPMVAVKKGNPLGIHSIQDMARPGVRVGLTEKTVMTGNIARLMSQKAGVADAFAANVKGEYSAGRQLGEAILRDEIDAGVIWNIVIFNNRDKLDAVDIPANIRPQRGIDAEVYSPELGTVELDYIRITVAALNSSKHPKEADDFARFVASPAGWTVFAEHGFSPPDPTRPTLMANRKPPNATTHR